jgi:hypothetical protein
VAAAAAVGGGVALAAGSRSTPRQPNRLGAHPASERVPSGVRVVDVTLQVGRRHSYYRLPSAATKPVVAVLNSLEIVQAGTVSSCPMESADTARPLLTLYFRAGSGPAHPALARAQVYVVQGKHGYSGWTPCDPISFWIGNDRQTPLVSDTFVAEIARLTGANIS